MNILLSVTLKYRVSTDNSKLNKIKKRYIIGFVNSSIVSKFLFKIHSSLFKVISIEFSLEKIIQIICREKHD